MEMHNAAVMVHVRERPARKLILVRGHTCGDYFAFCEEVGCDVWDRLCAIQGALHEPIGMWMPPALRPEGTSFYTQGVEVAMDYAGAVPDGCEVIGLPPALYLFFQGAPYPDPGFADEIRKVQAVIGGFQPRPFGYEWADDDAPRVQLAPVGSRGYIEGRPVRRLSGPSNGVVPF